MTLAQSQVMRGEAGFTSFDAAFRDVAGSRPRREWAATCYRAVCAVIRL